jgi:hypothetical protein
VWEEGGRYPDVIVELLSNSTEKVDRTTKKQLYQDSFRTPEYFWFHPETLELAGFRLSGASYRPILGDERDWRYSEQLGLYLGVHEGQDSYGTSAPRASLSRLWRRAYSRGSGWSRMRRHGSKIPGHCSKMPRLGSPGNGLGLPRSKQGPTTSGCVPTGWPRDCGPWESTRKPLLKGAERLLSTDIEWLVSRRRTGGAPGNARVYRRGSFQRRFRMAKRFALGGELSPWIPARRSRLTAPLNESPSSAAQLLNQRRQVIVYGQCSAHGLQRTHQAR